MRKWRQQVGGGLWRAHSRSLQGVKQLATEFFVRFVGGNSIKRWKLGE